MKHVVFVFRDLSDLLDFESLMEREGHHTDHAQLTITGDFEEADVELAKAGYRAVVFDDMRQTHEGRSKKS